MIAGGTPVRVQLTFDRRWAGGFEVADCFERDGTDHYLLRRQSDGWIVPMPFPADRVQAEASRRLVLP